MKRLLTLFLIVTLGVSAAFPNGWQANPDPAAEVIIVDDYTVAVGTPGVLETDEQPVAVHGATMALPPAQAYKVAFFCDLYTWDSYNELDPDTYGTGYWDSFSVSLSQSEYWNLGLADPINGDPLAVGFLWGGTLFGDGVREETFDGDFVTMAASITSMNYLNVVLDTATPPEHNGFYPSWGTFEIIFVERIVPIDIKPTSCPNPVNVKSKGVLPVAVLGMEGFDVRDIDVDSVYLNDLHPIRFDYEDVATPFDGELCDCHTEGPDGYLDLTLKFDMQQVVESLGPVADGDELKLNLGIGTVDGIATWGSDCIRIIKKGD
jgi:hypothetical protein